MTNFIGKRNVITSTMEQLEAHASHLRHLTNPSVLKGILKSRFSRTPGTAEKDSKIISAHIHQAIEFFKLSKNSELTIRPVLQYYCYLNLAVAVILSYKPPNFEQYRKHGVEDLTHTLKRLELSSKMLKVKNNGALPLFNSIISDVNISNTQFRFNELVGSISYLGYEFIEAFKKDLICLHLDEKILQNKQTKKWVSIFMITSNNEKDSQYITVSQNKIETAMPKLRSKYNLFSKTANSFTYHSKEEFVNEKLALRHHKENGLKIINYGGHVTDNGGQDTLYRWYSMKNKYFIPTITSSLMLLFSFASIARYRPNILNCVESSNLNLLFDVFVNEVDGYMLPVFRNLLYREDMYISKQDFI